MASLTKEDGLKLLKDGKFTDFKIICEDHTFDVHKNITAAKSPFLTACIEGAFQDSERGAVILKEVRAEIVGMALIYVYAGGLYADALSEIWPVVITLNDQRSNTDITTINVLLDLYEFSDRLMMPDLRQSAADAILIGAKNIRNRFLDKSNKDDKAIFISILDLIYENTDRQDKLLRLRLTKLCLSRQKKLMEIKAVVDVIEKHESITWAVRNEGIWNEGIDNTIATIEGMTDAGDGAWIAAKKRRRG